HHGQANGHRSGAYNHTRYHSAASRPHRGAKPSRRRGCVHRVAAGPSGRNLMKSDGHILIVDDESALRQTLARILQRAGFEVTTSPTGHDALELLSQHTFDLVYLDIRMPDINGLEVLKTMNTNYPEVSVVLFTAQPDLNSAVQALRHG